MADQLPFQEAIDFFAGKVNLPTKRWNDLRHAAHVHSFSVAGVTRLDMLADFRAAMEKARREGTGFNEFQKSFNEIVDRTGWTFNARGETDLERRAWRARIIYKTNMRTSYMAGRYKQLTDPDVLKYRPYWQYKHSGALHPRQLHLSWDGIVLLATDPAWSYMFPPNGWGCGCDIVALSKRQLKALGKDGPDQAPVLTPYLQEDPRTGQMEMRIPGIDRGWEYNVGEEWLHGIVPVELRTPLNPLDEGQPSQDLPAMPAASKAKKSDLMETGLDPQSYVDAFLSAFQMDQEGGYYRDVSGGIITLGRSMFEMRSADGEVLGLKADKRGRGAYTLLLADAVKDPDEIWVDWVTVKSGVALRRAYLKRVLLPDGRALFVRFEWTSKGWTAVTGFDTDDAYIANFRRGALLFRRT
ncbi:PBECR2 nuclease fold domain-containing protein [uncultured Cohaesibacter sp.]|uniref:PBECR2 nuclease fold domain-containing protein n=1 Tax=uncultured Cohaesibacter sp. TaxID=1002546 RepID=UPI0029C67738|nr:PBECR2 nuclease fold domain-containing protein [uncultured Cohaesibacter sp.]